MLVNRQLISKTLLGWVLHGHLEENSPKLTHNEVLCDIHSSKIKDYLDILHDLVKQQWRVESISNKIEEGLSPEERRAQKILDMTMERVGNMYQKGLSTI